MRRYTERLLLLKHADTGAEEKWNRLHAHSSVEGALANG